ncbi:MAG TPA: hypothetical protein VHA30_03795 [Patescibacteria group bacterium]|nr:hypothetical protein [Patescibacteria group bacterium]
MDTPDNQTKISPEPLPPGGEAAPASPRSEYLFFNVMPKSRGQAQVVQPTLKISQDAGAPGAGPDFLQKHKALLLIILAILIVGAAVYFIFNYIGRQSYQPTNYLISHPDAPAASSTQPAANSTPGSFTTSQDWRDKFFPGCQDASLCGDTADPDHDGLTNQQEFLIGTDPNNPDSDQDGLSDGDETDVFGTNPLNGHTANDPQYNDSDYVKGGYDLGTGKKLSQAQIQNISAKMAQFGLHEPTLRTLGDVVNSVYGFSTGLTPAAGNMASSTPAASSTDESLSAKQDRDTQRSNTIKNIEAGLVKYQADNQTYPLTSDFGTMFAYVKPYLKVATNPTDPVNQPPYVYTYAANADGSDFSLSFYSEVAGQLISKNAADAQKDTSMEQAGVYDNQRETDLETLRTALLLYSQSNVAGSQDYVFPTKDKYKTALVPSYISQIPKDPKTGVDYDYEVSATFNTFTLKAVLDNPPAGTTGYLCNQDSCQNY